MRRYTILSVGVDALSRQEFHSLCVNWLEGSGQHHIVTVNPEFIMEAQKNERFLEVLKASSCALADGFGLLCASLLFFGKQVFSRITGVQATLDIAQIAARLGKKIYLIGGQEGVAQKTADSLKKLYPSVRIIGAEEGIPIKRVKSIIEHESELLARIQAARPEVLFVAFGAPKQELWISENLSRLPSVKIAIGVGGTFDYLAGEVKYAPSLMRKMGLEWLYRLIREPQRIHRIKIATVCFPLAVLRSKIFGH